MTVVDIQAHVFPKEYLAALERVAAGSGRGAETARLSLDSPMIAHDPIFTTAIGERLELMDSAGIDLQALSFPAPNVWSDDVDVRKAMAASFNDGVATIARDHPGRFALLAALPLPFVDAAIEEAERALGQLGASGFGICTHLDALPIDDRRFDPLYEYLDSRRAAVLLHPEGFFVRGALEDHGMEWAIGTPFDDTIASIRLIYGGLLDRFPSIQWIVPHLGGALPFLAQRLDFIWRFNPQVNSLLDREPSSYLDRIWFDTVNPDPRAISLAGEVLGWDRLLFGTDFPFAARNDLGHALSSLRAAGITGDEHEAVTGSRAERLLAPST